MQIAAVNPDSPPASRFLDFMPFLWYNNADSSARNRQDDAHNYSEIIKIRSKNPMANESKDRRSIMKICAVICECNPIHNGHAYLFRRIREAGAAGIIAIMSGNAVQRGSLAIADKYVRAACVMACGADLVLELPYPYACAGSEVFGTAGVWLAARLGADTLAFGSETGDAELLQHAADAIRSADFISAYRERVRAGAGTAGAWAETYREVCGSSLPGGANDLLAVSYLAAIGKHRLPIPVFPVKRIGSDYRADFLPADLPPSATAVRAYLKCTGRLPDTGIPEIAVRQLEGARADGRFPVCEDAAADMILPLLRLAKEKDLKHIAGCGGGLSGRLCAAARQSTTGSELMQKLRTGNYPDARLRRTLLFCLTGTTDADLHTLPAYTTLLAASGTGRALLAGLRKNASVPIVTKPADRPAVPEALRQSRQSDLLDALYTLAMPQRRSADWFFKCSPTIDLTTIC